ncbi:16S rRNA (uracil(1498)-N(3))-methyltransferase [Filomicrobium sp.]|uniref:16S rRNA (uracil(1498)-N(3))-methyltransferase n=1 Tax=Filomicrobium sp. TaxID=2024831 RepID=UPI002583DBD1|nr:16S rRNA (uracil(1498)-N(3))-methyltransferase [Filomicrobium sp.]MCV0368746.1 16S rRNA (uracil(1498)-N(3))-methyltransferase [Filomicrobium sp.]
MAVHDFNAERLFVDAALAPGATITCTNEQVNYLINVLRLKNEDEILIFNGRDGEWRAAVSDVSKRRCNLIVHEQVRPQESGPDLHYVFAPLKRARLDYIVQKAVELGAARLRPVITRRTIAERVNLERMRSNVIEAAEQCGILALPAVDEPVKFSDLLAGWDGSRRIIFCDEAAETASPLAALQQISPGPVAVLVGPEGGFDATERTLLLGRSDTTAISLGPRIMRADTAAVAALSLVNSVLGDWA